MVVQIKKEFCVEEWLKLKKYFLLNVVKLLRSSKVKKYSRNEHIDVCECKKLTVIILSSFSVFH